MAQQSSKNVDIDVAAAQKTALDMFHAGDHLGSNKRLLELVGATGPNSFRSFCIGRNYRHLNEPELARSWLTSARDMRNPFIWVYIELARLEQDSGRCYAAWPLVDAFFNAIGQPVPAFTNMQKRLLLEVSHAQFSHDHWTGLAIYRRLEAVGIEDAISAARLLEDLLNSGEVDAALARLPQFRGKFSTDTASQLVVARVLRLRGDDDAAAVAARRWRTSLTWRTAYAAKTIAVARH